MSFKRSNLEELIGALRVQIGDYSAIATYSDETLHNVLRYAVNALMRRWGNKYYVDNSGIVNRNLDYVSFDCAEPPVIQRQDERAIVLQASIMIKSGAKFSTVSSVVSWRDEEFSYSNTEAARQRSSTLNDDIAELDSILPPPNKKLARAKMGRLEGFTADWSVSNAGQLT